MTDWENLFKPEDFEVLHGIEMLCVTHMQHNCFEDVCSSRGNDVFHRDYIAASVANAILKKHLSEAPVVYQLNQSNTTHVWVPAGYNVPPHTHSARLVCIEEIK